MDLIANNNRHAHRLRSRRAFSFRRAIRVLHVMDPRRLRQSGPSVPMHFRARKKGDAVHRGGSPLGSHSLRSSAGRGIFEHVFYLDFLHRANKGAHALLVTSTSDLFPPLRIDGLDQPRRPRRGGRYCGDLCVVRVHDAPAGRELEGNEERDLTWRAPSFRGRKP